MESVGSELNGELKEELKGELKGELNGDSKVIFDQIKPMVDEMVGAKKISAELFRPLLIQLIRLIESHTKEKYDKLDGSHKKQIALTVLDYVIKDLKSQNKIDPSTADAMIIGLEFIGPAVIDFAAAFAKKVVEEVKIISDDISKNGCKGCFGRNCTKKK
jgi:hypothetical protein